MTIQSTIDTETAAPAPETLWFADSRVNVRLAKDASPAAISVLEHFMPYDSAPPTHVHHDEDELFCVLEGQIRFEVGGQSRVAGPGEMLLAPKGVPHGFRVLSPEGARTLTVTRGGFEAMVRGMSRPAGEALLPPRASAPTAEMQAVFARTCLDQNIELLGPPIA